ncbi:MAG TPA: hypothetical protein VF214_07720 [Edaphobacter sp.]
MTFHDDLTTFLSDPHLELDLFEARERRTQRLDEIRRAFSRPNKEFFAAQRPVFKDWRHECRDAETRYLHRKLQDASIARFPGLAQLLSSVLEVRN